MPVAGDLLYAIANGMGKCTTDIGKAVAYLRVSTDDQSLGLEAQRAAIETWARHRGVEIVAWCADDGVSGATPIDERKGLCEALQAREDHDAGMLVVAKRDRLARDMMVSLVLESQMGKVGARIVSCAGEGTESDDPTAQLMRGIIDLFAQYERAMIRARTRAALAAKQARGERLGACPFGYRKGQGGELERNESEQATIARIREFALQGGTLRQIAQTLAHEGYTSRSGLPLGLTQIQRILAQERDAA